MSDHSVYEQQRLIADSARRFFENHYGFAVRQQLIAEEPGYSTEQWRAMADLGWMQLPLSADHGGWGGDMHLLSAMHKEFGRAQYVGPFLSSAVIATHLINESDPASFAANLRNEIGTGDTIVAPAMFEPQARYALHEIATSATAKPHAVVLNGRKSAVFYGNVATELLVLTHIGSQTTETLDLALCLVPADHDGVSMTHYRMHDGSRVSELELNAVTVSRTRLLAQGHRVRALVNYATNVANALICAELVGAMEATLDMTVEHLKTRNQFGRKLSSFQALQHRVVDMYIRCQLAESMRQEAASACHSTSAVTQDLIIASAKCEIAQAALLNAEEAVQLHGAMGMMDDMPVGHYLKRIFTLTTLFGNADYHRTRYRNLRLQIKTGDGSKLFI